MCGPSSQEKSAQSQQASLASTLSANYNQNFANQSQVLGNLNRLFTPIAQAGPDQQGFGANELAALNTAAGEGIGNNYAKATQALNNQLAARGGGNEFLPTGARAALKGSLASSAANALSQAQIGITEANYAQGRSNWSQANAGLQALAEAYNPNAIAGQANQGLSSSFNMAHQINQEQNQKWADIAGGITGLASMAAGGFGNLDMTGGSSPLEQVGNFIGGMH